MTDYTELIRSLRNCSNNRCTPCDCGWFNKYQVDESCKEIIMWKAAAAIEDMAKHITEMHERVTVLQIARGELEAEVKRLKESNEELQQIADHYEQTAKDYWKEACEYKAQLPKRGKWELIDGAEPMRWGCSRCKYMSWETSTYCPRCGAKMEVQDGQE